MVYSQVNLSIRSNARPGQRGCWLETQLNRKSLMASDVNMMMSLPNPSCSRREGSKGPNPDSNAVQDL